jgi:hypothetical protein
MGTLQRTSEPDTYTAGTLLVPVSLTKPDIKELFHEKLHAPKIGDNSLRGAKSLPMSLTYSPREALATVGNIRTTSGPAP